MAKNIPYETEKKLKDELEKAVNKRYPELIEETRILHSEVYKEKNIYKGKVNHYMRNGSNLTSLWEKVSADWRCTHDWKD